jgi:membrane protease YdiL (CAAX protease family)
MAGNRALSDRALLRCGKAFKRALALDPRDAFSRYWLARTLFDERQFEEAKPHYEKVLQQPSSAGNPGWELALCLLYTRDFTAFFSLGNYFYFRATAALTAVYLVGMTLLIRQGFSRSGAPAPALMFSTGWLLFYYFGAYFWSAICSILGVWGIIDFLRYSGIAPLVGSSVSECILVVTAGWGFKRQPWGKLFEWPQSMTGRMMVAVVGGAVLLAFAIDITYFLVFRWSFGHEPSQWMQSYIFAVLSLSPALVVVSVVLIGPIFEEVLFRGLIYTSLHKRFGSRTAITVSAALFGALHLSISNYVPLALIGVILACLREETGSIVPPVLTHIVFNGIWMIWFSLATGGM